jgi:NADH-quinone oxidoreductase subunit G
MSERVNLTIDGKQVSVAKGTNLIEAAKAAGVEVPYYCYHPHLSVAGNCRMCQVQVEGQPKMTIACNTQAAEGMVVKTQESSADVSNAQRATLEFLLINHPLDCTVCDQAGHCKLQDYYFEYNRAPSRFIEEKEHKVKAEVLGPHVVYDGERCIVCTRCSRFCEEVTGTSELGVFNRGDKAVIGVFPGKELNNPLSGSVVDLCPVGALTHRPWRFNTRIWYTKEFQSVCPGCSTGCNVRAATRDGEIVHIKGRLNSFVNKEWMCDEGRYGFDRFQPKNRLTGSPVVRDGSAFKPVAWDEAFKKCEKLFSGTKVETAVILSPFLTVEEVWTALLFSEQALGVGVGSRRIAMQLRERSLNEVEKILISPDYAPNGRAAMLFGLVQPDEQDWRKNVQSSFENLLSEIRKGAIKRVLFVGDFSLPEAFVDDELRKALSACELIVGITAREPGSVEQGWEKLAHVVFPGRTVNEKSGVLMNATGRIQKLSALLAAPFGTLPEWLVLSKLASAYKKQVLPVDVADERSLFRSMTNNVTALKGLTLAKLGELGLTLEELGALETISNTNAERGSRVGV